MKASEHYLREMDKALRELDPRAAVAMRWSKGGSTGSREFKREPVKLPGGCMLYRLNPGTAPCAR